MTYSRVCRAGAEAAKHADEAPLVDDANSEPIFVFRKPTATPPTFGHGAGGARWHRANAAAVPPRMPAATACDVLPDASGLDELLEDF